MKIQGKCIQKNKIYLIKLKKQVENNSNLNKDGSKSLKKTSVST